MIALIAAFGLASGVAHAAPDFDAKRVQVADPDGETVRMTRASAQVVVDASPEEVWELLADFGGVEDYLLAITASDWIGGTEMGDGAARYCDISFQGRNVHVKERIFDYVEGSEFTYDVYDWTNFPLDRMHNTFGVMVDDAGQTVVYNVIDYKLKPRMLSGVMRGTMSRSARGSLLGIKHYLETGDASLDRDQLFARYP